MASNIFSFFILDEAYNIVTITIINTPITATIMLSNGINNAETVTTPLISFPNKYVINKETGMAYNRDLRPKKILSKYKILLNPFGVNPTLLSNQSYQSNKSI